MTPIRITSLIAIAALTTVVTACSPKVEQQAAEAEPAPAAKPVENPIVVAVNSTTRSDADKSRDRFRHPAESLEFWGLQPGMAILEVQPGGGWWTEILAPYAHATGGKYYATGADLGNPELSEGARKGRTDFEARFAAKPEVYGTVSLVNFGPKSAPMPANTFDFILTARSVHGWMSNGIEEKVFKDLYGALKPGGILAVEQHRAKPGEQDPKAVSGYVTEDHVIKLAQQAGFELVAKSEINANPADTADHPFGVWTLPPSSRTRPYSEGADANDPNFDRTKYDAIGESDRMTLRFRKPESAA